MKYLYALFLLCVSSALFAEECTRTVKPDGQAEIFCMKPDLMPHTETYGNEIKMGFKDQKGNLVIPVEWDFALLFTEDLAPVQRDGKWGYINKSGQVVIALEYDNAQNFWQGKAQVEKDCQSFHIDKQGRQIDSPKKSSICLNPEISAREMSACLATKNPANIKDEDILECLER